MRKKSIVIPGFLIGILFITYLLVAHKIHRAMKSTDGRQRRAVTVSDVEREEGGKDPTVSQRIDDRTVNEDVETEEEVRPEEAGFLGVSSETREAEQRNFHPQARSATPASESSLMQRFKIERSYSLPQAGKGMMRYTLVETDFKYPKIMVKEERIKTAGGERVEVSARVADRYLVRLREGEDRRSLEQALQDEGGEVEKALSVDGIYLVYFPLKQVNDPTPWGLEHVWASLEGLIDHAEHDLIIETTADPALEPYFVSGEQWGLYNTGEQNGLAGADIDAGNAWRDQGTAAGVTVAVIDTGMLYSHQDLASRMWTNSGEIPDDNIDNDGNGVIDDVYGLDAYNRDGDPADDNGHGTHCAGIIGADGRNAFGMAGVAPDVSLMALKFLSESGAGATSDALETIQYAIDHGADILNLSWGSPRESPLLRDLLIHCGEQGILVAAAAGNDADNVDNRPTFPGSFDLPLLVTVAATDARDQLAGYSNFGPQTVEIAAPGSDILSTWIGSNQAFNRISGTSMAAPHVAGVLALLRAKYSLDEPGETVLRLMNGSESLSTLENRVAQKRRLNAYQSLLAPAVPANDLLENAFSSDPHVTKWWGSSRHATADTVDGITLETSVWYAWQPPAGGQGLMEFETREAAQVTVFRENAGGAVRIAGPFSAGRHGLIMAENQTYLLAVHGSEGVDFHLSLQIPPENDDREDAFPTAGPYWTTRGSSLGATLEHGETDFGRGAEHSVWWAWTAPYDGAARIHTHGSDFDTVLAMYSENELEGIIQGSTPDVVFVNDISGSVLEPFQGAAVGDANQDGRDNTVLDAEVAAMNLVTALLETSGFYQSSRSGLVTFESGAGRVDLDPVTPGMQNILDTAADTDANGTWDIQDAGKSLRAGGRTNYEAALQKALETFDAITTPPGNANLLFFSDGHPNEGLDYQDEVAALRARGVNIRAFGTGLGASLADLRQIDPLALIFVDAIELMQVLEGMVAFNDDHQGLYTSEVNVSVVAGTTYYIRVDGYGGESGDVRLSCNMYSGLEILNQSPDTVRVERDADTVLFVETRGVAPIRIQWFKDGVPLDGETGTELELSGCTSAEEGVYHASVMNRFERLESDPITLEVFVDPPRIVRGPQSRQVEEGSPVTLTVEVEGTPPFSYQWYRDGNLMNGQTQASLYWAAFQAADQGAYAVRVTNDDGMADSLSAMLETTVSPVGGWRFPARQGPIWSPDWLESIGDRFLAFKNGYVAGTRDGGYWDLRDFRDMLSSPENGFSVSQVVSRDGLLVVVAWNNSHPVLFSTADGLNWEEIPLPQFSSIHRLSDGGDHWIAYVVTPESNWEFQRSVDLENWTRVDGLIPYTVHPLTPAGSEWAYLATDDPASQYWYSTGFNDSAWPRGNAELGYGDGGETTVIPDDPGQDRVYFRGRPHNATPYYRMKVKGRIRYDDAAYVRLSSNVLYDDYQGGPVVAKPEGFEDGWVDIPLWDNPNLTGSNYDLIDMRPGSEPYITAEIHKSGAGDSDLSFDLELTGHAHHGMYGPTFDGTQWLLLRGDGTAFFSTDGVNWQTETTTGLPFVTHYTAGRRMRTEMAPVEINGTWIVWFYKRSTDKGYFTSEDGITWTERSWPRYLDANNWQQDMPLDPDTLERAGGGLVFMGPSMWRTIDGITWEQWISPPAEDLSAQNIRSPSKIARMDEEWLTLLGSRYYQRTLSLEDLTQPTYVDDDYGLRANRMEVHNGRLYAVEGYLDSNGDINVSTDGDTWRSINGVNDLFRDVLYRDGIFIVADNQLRSGSTPPHRGYITLMADHDVYGPYAWQTLERRDWPMSWMVRTLALSGDVVIAAGTDGGIATTTDLQNWTLRRPSSDVYGELIHSQVLNGVYFAYSTQGEVLRSDDMETFTALDVDAGGNTIRDGAYGNGVYLLACEQEGETVVYRSTDGMVWNRQTLGMFGNANGLAFGGGGFVLVAGQHSFYSTDGLNWTAREQVGAGECKDVVWYNGSFRISAVNQVDGYTTIYRSGSEEPPEPPTITVEGFLDAYEANDQLSVSIEASGPAAITSVEVFINQRRIASSHSAPFLWQTTDLAPGSHDVAVYVTDANGNTGLFYHRLTVDFPEALILAPSRLGKMDTILRTSENVLYGYLDGSREGTLEIFRTFDGRRWRPVRVDPDRPVGTASLSWHTSLTELPDGNLLILAKQSDGNTGVYHSVDGVNWTRVHQATSGWMDKLLTVQEHVLLVPPYGNAANYSTNGRDWASVTLETGGVQVNWMDYSLVNWRNSLFAYAIVDPPFYRPQAPVDGLVTGNGLQWTPVELAERFIYQRTLFIKGPDHLIAWDPENGASQARVSINGIDWTPLADFTALDFVHLQVVDDQYIGTTADGLWRSDDLRNWTRLFDRSGGMEFLEHGQIYPMPGQWVWMDFRKRNIGENIRTLAVSEDQGVNWTHLLDTENVYAGAMASNETTLVVQTEETLTVFEKGIEIGRLSTPLDPEWDISIAFLNGQWVVWGLNPVSGNVESATSSDLQSWSLGLLPFMGELNFIQGEYVLTTNNRIAFSADLSAWQEHTELDDEPLTAVKEVGYASGSWLVLNGTRVHVSSDLTNWATLANPQPSYSGEVFLVDGVLYYETFRYNPPLYRSTDFTEWVQQPFGFSIPEKPLASRGDLYINMGDLDGNWRTPDTVNVSLDGGQTYSATGIGANALTRVSMVEDSLYVVTSGFLHTLSLLDFVPEELVVQTDGTPGPGSTVDVSFSIRNQGYVDQTSNRDIAVHLLLSPDSNLADTNNIQLATETWQGQLARDATVSLTFPGLPLPEELAPGAYYLGVRIDTLDTVTELNEVNNNRTSSLPLLIVGGRRLVVNPGEGGTVLTGSGLPAGMTQSDGGLTTLSGEIWLSQNAELNLIPKAEKGYRFVGWLEAPGRGLTPLGVKMDGDKTLTPLFQKILSVDLTVQGGGTVSSIPPDLTDLTEGESVTLNALAQPGWSFLEWDGSLKGTDNSLEWILVDSERIRAVFVRNSIQYIHWRNEHFNIYERLDETMSGTTGNTGEDSATNLAEYMFKGNPKQPDSRNFGFVYPSAAGTVRLRYNTDPRISDYRAVLKRSTDLVNWQTVPATPTRTPLQYNEEQVDIELDITGEPEGVYYYRFEIEPK